MLSLERDGQFATSNFPWQRYDSGFSEWGFREWPPNVRGTWKIDRIVPDSPELNLSVGRGGHTFLIGYEHDEWIIFFFIGDPDEWNRYILHK